MLLQQADREAAEPGEIVGQMPLARPALVFVERDVEHPVQGIFDAPMPADGLSKSTPTHVAADDEVADIAALAAVTVCCDADHHADRLDAGPLFLQRKAGRQLDEIVVSSIDAAVAFVARLVSAMWYSVEVVFYITAKYRADNNYRRIDFS